MQAVARLVFIQIVETLGDVPARACVAYVHARSAARGESHRTGVRNRKALMNLTRCLRFVCTHTLVHTASAMPRALAPTHSLPSCLGRAHGGTSPATTYSAPQRALSKPLVRAHLGEHGQQQGAHVVQRVLRRGQRRQQAVAHGLREGLRTTRLPTAQHQQSARAATPAARQRRRRRRDNSAGQTR